MPPPAITAAVHFSIGGTSVHDRCRHDRPGDEGGWCSQGVEEIVYDRNVVSQDFRNRRHTEHYQGGRRTKPCKVMIQGEMPGISRDVHNEHRQKYSKAGRSGERDT